MSPQSQEEHLTLHLEVLKNDQVWSSSPLGDRLDIQRQIMRTLSDLVYCWTVWATMACRWGGTLESTVFVPLDNGWDQVCTTCTVPLFLRVYCEVFGTTL